MSTTVGRAGYSHPDLGATGGAGLEAQIQGIYTQISDSISGRWNVFTAIANSAVTTITHNFGVPYADLKIYFYTGTHPSLVRVANPTAAGWTIAANATNPKTQIDITAPSSGGLFGFTTFIVHGRGSENLSDLSDAFISTPLDGQELYYNTTAGKFVNSFPYWQSEAATIATNVLTPTIGRMTQRITTFTGATSDLQTIANPAVDKVLVLVNETGADVIVKNNTGATTTNRIYTGTGLDLTFKSQAALLMIYDGTLQRWVIVGGAGGGAKNTIEAVATVAGTAVTNTRYAFRLTATGQTIQFPTDNSAFEITILDAGGNFSSFPLTINGITGQTIATGAAGEAFSCNYNSFLGTFSRAQGSSKINFDPQMTSTVPQSTSTTQGTTSGNTGYPGNLTGSASATNNIGEKIVGSNLSGTLATNTNLSSSIIPLTAGSWLVIANPRLSGNLVGSRSVFQLGSDVVSTITYGCFDTQSVATSANNISATLTAFIQVTSPTNIYVNVFSSYSSGTCSYSNLIVPYAVRIA